MLEEFMPHGHCFIWRPDILFPMVLGNFLIFLAYITIPITLLYMNHKYQAKIGISGSIIAYVLFIVSCGIGHLIDIFMIWNGYYKISAWWSLFTSFWSIIAALLTFTLLDKVGLMVNIDEAVKFIEEQDKRLKR